MANATSSVHGHIETYRGVSRVLILEADYPGQDMKEQAVCV